MTLNYEETQKLTNEQVLKLLKDKYPVYELYNISLGWRENRKYILKAKGVYGDVIVNWSERG